MNSSKEPLQDKSDNNKNPHRLERRDFLQGLSTVPVLGLFGYALKKENDFKNAQRAANAGPKPSKQADLNVALIGHGNQGQVLLQAMLKIPNLRFRAVCDIWTERNLKLAVGRLKHLNSKVNGYEDYREMLDKEKDLDAVVIATPDFWHARHTIDSLNAGINVYCEKEMSNTLDGARQMVRAARQTGKLLQIGHQRRSHPRYIHCCEKLLKEANLIGRIITVNAQWNRYRPIDNGCEKKYYISQDRLSRYGFSSMQQFLNWRWYKGLGGGPIVDLGSHQIDIFNWFLDARPTAVMADGGKCYKPDSSHQWYDTVMAVYEYETHQGKTLAYYQTQTHNGSQKYFENFMGDCGTLVLSESESGYKGSVYRQPGTKAWDEWIRKGYVSAPQKKIPKQQEALQRLLDIRESRSPDEHHIPIDFHDPYHKPHLENFFNAIRGTETLNCPAQVGYETAVSVLKVNQAIEAGKRLYFEPNEFAV